MTKLIVLAFVFALPIAAAHAGMPSKMPEGGPGSSGKPWTPPPPPPPLPQPKQHCVPTTYPCGNTTCTGMRCQ